MTSRGLIELAIGKQTAYVVQAAAAFLLVGCLRRRATIVPGTRRWGSYVAVYALVFSGLVSTFFTINRWSLASATTPLLYVATMIALGLLLCWGSDADRRSDAIQIILPSVVAVISLQVAAAIAQQYMGWGLLSGTDYGTFGDQARPSGLTGSYLHYPLVLAVMGIVVFGAWRRRGSAILLCATGLAVFGILASYSRSGMMILAFTIVIAVSTGRTMATKVASVLALVVAWTFISLAFSENPVLVRALSALDLSSAGNSGRVRQWTDAMGSWFDSPLLFGSYTGLVTNISRNFGGSFSLGVVESSLLQQLLNLGIVGTVATYWLLGAVVRAVPVRDIWVRAGVSACILQTLIYQSIEVLPYVALLAIVPLVFTHASSPTPAHTLKSLGPRSTWPVGA
ncbi:hypothetical protein [Agromyces sp. Leaf222]|uniref:hypothetical protein n=1 Tax=Agromyces sp. Leaf222 TaxID=1735688 RepID=UPI0012F93A66|nr:hypothetical protein [Agromyces sp. Leaf222]